MINLSGMKILALNRLGRTGLVLSKRSPQILLGVGIGGVVVGTILACRATLELEKVLEDTKATLDKIDDTRMEQINEAASNATPITYSGEAADKDTALVYIQTGVKVAKLYAPAVLVTGVSLGLIIGSHRIMSQRNAAIAAAYKLVDASFKQYRARVKEEYGDEADSKFRFGQKEITVTETTKKGNQKKLTKKVLGNDDIAPYSFKWEEGATSRYQRSYIMNHFLLKSQQLYANDILNIRGHVFLNEVLDSLGLKRTPEGAVTGWVKGYNPHNENNAGYITFDYDNPINQELEDPREAMVQPWYLNFNVDGNIWDII